MPVLIGLLEFDMDYYFRFLFRFFLLILCLITKVAWFGLRHYVLTLLILLLWFFAGSIQGSIGLLYRAIILFMLFYSGTTPHSFENVIPVVVNTPLPPPVEPTVLLWYQEPLVLIFGGASAVLLLVSWVAIIYYLFTRKGDSGYGGFHFERYVDGSQFMKSAMPSFCAKVFIRVGGSWYQSGMGFRTRHGFMTAAHVIFGADKVRLVSLAGQLEVEVSQFKHTKIGDVVVFNDDDALSGLAMTMANLSKAAMGKRDREMAMATNGESVSLGPVTCAEEFGYVNYGGSTVKGFSGSPYYLNKTVFGLHTGASTVNFGYEAGYLSACLESEESTEDWLQWQVENGLTDSKQSPYDPDEVLVKAGGKYFRMDRVDFDLARSGKRRGVPDTDVLVDRFIGSGTYEYESADIAYPDPVPENCERPAVTVTQPAGPSQPKEGASAPTKTLTTSPETKSKPQKVIRTEQAMDPRELIHAPNSKVSRITLAPTRKLSPSQRRTKRLAELKEEIAQLTNQLKLKSPTPFLEQ